MAKLSRPKNRRERQRWIYRYICICICICMFNIHICSSDRLFKEYYTLHGLREILSESCTLGLAATDVEPCRCRTLFYPSPLCTSVQEWVLDAYLHIHVSIFICMHTYLHTHACYNTSIWAETTQPRRLKSSLVLGIYCLKEHRIVLDPCVADS